MKNDVIYLTFPTDRETHEMLKFLAKCFNTSQPKLIETICKDFIAETIPMLNEIAEEELKKLGIDINSVE